MSFICNTADCDCVIGISRSLSLFHLNPFNRRGTQKLFSPTCRLCCRCCTSPPGTGSDTGVHTVPDAQLTPPWKQESRLDLCTLKLPLGAPCRLYSPEANKTGVKTASISASCFDEGRTSSGGLFTFCRYFFTTSSGVFPEDRITMSTDGGLWGKFAPLFLCSPFRVCFLVVFLQQWLKPGTGLISLLLAGGGCSTSFGGRVRHTGRAAALIRIPVIPDINKSPN